MSLELLLKRRSVRSYLPDSLPDRIRESLRSEATFINTHEAGLNFQLLFDDDAPFRGFVRSYGMFRNARNYLAAVIDPTFADAEERAGFFAQQFVLAATRLGLGTCFVGGTFSRSNVNARIEVYERIPFVVVFGMEDRRHHSIIGKLTAGMTHGKKMDSEDFFLGSQTEFQEASSELPWLPVALKAVACAPSALNKRPVRLHADKDEKGDMRLRAHVSDPCKFSVELGIAKCNVADVVPDGVWEWGNDGAFYMP